MKIGLASYRFINKDIAFNVSQIEKAMKSVQGKVELLCFGEAFLQGFDALSWNYEEDRQIAVSADSEIMQRLCKLTLQYKMGLLFGYIEKSGEDLYSSCAVMADGKVIHNYRRISRGWKEFSITDDHYKEGTDTSEFVFQGQSIMIALCGDMWDYPEKFKTDNLLIWPVYVNFKLEEWAQYEAEYAQQAYLAANQTLMINSISRNPDSCGGGFCFIEGRLAKRSAYNEEEVLIVSL